MHIEYAEYAEYLSHGFWLVSMVFQGGFMVFHGFWLVFMVFQGGFGRLNPVLRQNVPD